MSWKIVYIARPIFGDFVLRHFTKKAIFGDCHERLVAKQDKLQWHFYTFILHIFCKVEKVTCKVDMRSWQTEKNVCSIGQFIYQIGNSVCNVGKIIFRIWKSVCKVWKLICHTWTSFCKVENIICKIWKSVCKRDETPDRTECLHCRKDYCKVGLIGKIFKHLYWHQHKV